MVDGEYGYADEKGRKPNKSKLVQLGDPRPTYRTGEHIRTY